jgi:hypothetical protein
MYNRNTAGDGPANIGFGGDLISLASADYAVPDTVKAIVVVASGDIALRAVDGAADITVTGAPVGMILPWHCSVIRKTGTDATLATVEGR